VLRLHSNSIYILIPKLKFRFISYNKEIKTISILQIIKKSSNVTGN